MSDRDTHERNDGADDLPVSREQYPELEGALARALRRVDAPADLLTRVMAKVETEQRTEQAGRTAKVGGRTWLGWGWRSGWEMGWKPAWGALAAILVAGVLSGHVVHERRVEEQARERMQASRQFDVSVQITDKALDHAREQLRKAGVALDEDGR